MDERGDIILGGLVKMVASLLAGALILFEAGAVAINYVQVDDRARDAARAAAVAWNDIGRPEAVEAAAHNKAAELPGANVVAVEIADPVVMVTVSRAAPVLVADHLWFLRDHLVANVTARARDVH